MSQPEYRVRWMIRRDMPEVMRIENQSFDDPWTTEQFIGCLRTRNVIGMVAELDDRVVGYMVYEFHKNRLHLKNFAVDFDFRRKGVGRAMVQKLISKLGNQRDRLMLEVRESNLPGQLFFRSLGFRAEAIVDQPFDNCDEDGYLMVYRADKAAESLATS